MYKEFPQINQKDKGKNGQKPEKAPNKRGYPNGQ